MYGNNDWRDYLAHSKKGSTWKNHKYLRKENGVYIYAKNVSDSAKGVVDAAKDVYKADKLYKKEKKDAAKANKDLAKAKKAEYETREEIDKNVAAREDAKSRILTKKETIFGTSYGRNKEAAKEADEYDKKVSESVEKLNNQIKENRLKERLAKRKTNHAAYKAKVKDESVKKLSSAGKKFVNNLFGKKT